MRDFSRRLATSYGSSSFVDPSGAGSFGIRTPPVPTAAVTRQRLRAFGEHGDVRVVNVQNDHRSLPWSRTSGHSWPLCCDSGLFCARSRAYMRVSDTATSR